MALIDKETIRKEIERRKEECDDHHYYLDNSEQSLGYSLALDDILAFLDTLQEQPMEGLEDEYVRFVRTDHHQHQFLLGKAGIDIARHFAEWGAKQVKSND